MALNNLNRFVQQPTTLDVRRSKFYRNFSHKTTFNAGRLIPIMVDEVLPGDTAKIDLSSVVRMITPAVPVMDNAFLDVYCFFVPSRLCTRKSEDWPQINGENTTGYWANISEKTLLNTGNAVPLSNFYNGDDIDVESPSIYMGLPYINVGEVLNDEVSVNLMPFVGYWKIWNEFFRDQNTQAPIDIDDYLEIQAYKTSLGLMKVNKIHDYFTSALPSPQKGESVMLPLGDLAPVLTGDTHTSNTNNGIPLRLWAANGDDIKTGNLMTDGNGNVHLTNNGYSGAETAEVNPKNLWADLSTATSSTINQVRQAFAIQGLLETSARYGSRYRETLYAFFGVTLPDYTAQVPQYLGGKRIPLSIETVPQTSQTTETSYLGQLGSFSNTHFNDFICVKSFNEYGYLYTVCCVRVEQSYSQGISPMWTRNRRYDFYNPILANLGEQPIFKRELYLDSTASANNPIFGYKEAWAEYRYKPNMVTGYLAPNTNEPLLSLWTYTNKFGTAPVLNSTFMFENSDNLAKTLVDPDTNYQFLADFYFKVESTRPMPLYSIPALLGRY